MSHWKGTRSKRFPNVPKFLQLLCSKTAIWTWIISLQRLYSEKVTDETSKQLSGGQTQSFNYPSLCTWHENHYELLWWQEHYIWVNLNIHRKGVNISNTLGITWTSVMVTTAMNVESLTLSVFPINSQLLVYLKGTSCIIK